ncbi:MAG TPA: N,N-dimethylformamidase beta subunit family domain-containing protein [Candidatus Kapabacteria bacterium]|nr:N,N-dimethylformamidase beta subunit family domain-containing protein [Candidatus Kapabacteria bacterium]
MLQLIWRTSAMVCCLLFISRIAAAQEGGYVNDLSIPKGQTISFFISTANPTFDLTISRLGLTKEPVTTLKNLKGGLQSLPDSSFAKGCHWKVKAQLLIPEDWKSGIYEASFPSSTGEKKIIFVVKEIVPGSYGKTVVCLTVNTWQAYNNFGGKSLYGFNSDGGVASYKVSFDRPFSDATTALYYRWTDKLVKWLDEEELPVEYCTNLDLDRDPHFLDHYDTYVTVGHDEYWSKPERNACKWLLERAGRLIILSGNTCWWQVRLEDNFRTLVCYKAFAEDPLYGKQDSLVTINWRIAPVNDTENSLIGVSFEHGGYVNNDTIYPASKGYGGYTVYRATNWIYEGTGVRDGDIIGQSSAIVGYETDGAMIWWQTDGMIYPVGLDGTPKNFTILGISPTADKDGNRLGTATMGYFTTTEGGAVFNAATTDWVNGLDKGDTVIRRMTHNVFQQFLNRKSMPPVIVSYSPITFLKDSINFQSLYLAHRTLPLDPYSNDTLIVHAMDPMHKPLHFRWKIGYQVIGTDSVLVLKWYNKKDYKTVLFVSATVSNGFDSITMYWRLIDSSLRIWTYPPYGPSYQGGSYSYMPIAASMVDERPKCILESGPSWLTMDSTGTIRGTLDSLGSASIVIRATDSHGNSALQSYKIYVSAPASVASDAKLSTQMIVAPNPFSEKSHCTITLVEEARVSLDIFDLLGHKIKTLTENLSMAAGSHIVEWDGSSDLEKAVSGGVYLCQATIQDGSGKAITLTRKLIKE